MGDRLGRGRRKKTNLGAIGGNRREGMGGGRGRGGELKWCTFCIKNLTCGWSVF